MVSMKTKKKQTGIRSRYLLARDRRLKQRNWNRRFIYAQKAPVAFLPATEG